jgi:hypothetical protein
MQNVSTPDPRAKLSSADLLRRADEARRRGDRDAAYTFIGLASAVGQQEALREARIRKFDHAVVALRAALNEADVSAQSMSAIARAIEVARAEVGS